MTQTSTVPSKPEYIKSLYLLIIQTIENTQIENEVQIEQISNLKYIKTKILTQAYHRMFKAGVQRSLTKPTTNLPFSKIMQAFNKKHL